jgi:predicted nucleic acid-binding protein
VVSESLSELSRRLLAEDDAVATWWLSNVESASALNRLAREESLSPDGLRACLSDLELLAESWVEIQPVAQVRSVALRLLRVHALRAADALQVASAIVLAGEDRRSSELVCYDERLADAADREWFRIIRAA